MRAGAAGFLDRAGACGNDLDLAIGQLAERPDYTAGERARDWAGALKWNAVALARRPGGAGKHAR